MALDQSCFPHAVRSEELADPSIQGQRPGLGARLGARASARAGPCMYSLLNLSMYIRSRAGARARASAMRKGQRLEKLGANGQG